MLLKTLLHALGRNRALLLVRTSLVLVIDGDLLVQSALRAKLATGGPAWARMLSEAQARGADCCNPGPSRILTMICRHKCSIWRTNERR